jgi:hypothetical protein
MLPNISATGAVSSIKAPPGRTFLGRHFEAPLGNLDGVALTNGTARTQLADFGAI